MDGVQVEPIFSFRQEYWGSVWPQLLSKFLRPPQNQPILCSKVPTYLYEIWLLEETVPIKHNLAPDCARAIVSSN